MTSNAAAGVADVPCVSGWRRGLPLRRHGGPLSRLAATLALGALLLACDVGGGAEGGGAGGAAGPVGTIGSGGAWVEASAAVLPAVHSVWGTIPALGGTRWVRAPVGTAFAIRGDGVLLTNTHVVARQDGLVPRLGVVVQADTGAATWAAEVLAVDGVRDLALLRIADTTLVPVRWTEEPAPMGTPVATIGYGLPEGGIIDTTAEAVTTRFTIFRRFTAGHSSGYRTLVAGNPATNVLEVDLFLFPGVSGGPAFRPDGRVVGVNRGHLEFRQGASSYGHVIPTQVVRDFLESVEEETGVAADSVLGVEGGDASTSPLQRGRP